MALNFLQGQAQGSGASSSGGNPGNIHGDILVQEVGMMPFEAVVHRCYQCLYDGDGQADVGPSVGSSASANGKLKEVDRSRKPDGPEGGPGDGSGDGSGVIMSAAWDESLASQFILEGNISTFKNILEVREVYNKYRVDCNYVNSYIKTSSVNNSGVTPRGRENVEREVRAKPVIEKPVIEKPVAEKPVAAEALGTTPASAIEEECETDEHAHTDEYAHKVASRALAWMAAGELPLLGASPDGLIRHQTGR